mgnify:CR=1 FL=1
MKDLERVALEKKITVLSKALASLQKTSEKDLRELLLIIKRPGWTTPAELGFTNVVLDSIGQQVKLVNSMKTNFLKIAKTVGQ